MLIIFKMYIIETKPDFVFFDDKKLQRQGKFVGKRDFPIQNSYTGGVQCLSHSAGPEICDIISAKCYLKAVNLPILSPGYILCCQGF